MLQRGAPLRNVGRFGAQPAAFGLQQGERAGSLGDRPLRAAQRIARFLARFLLALELAIQRLDAPAQRLQLFLPACRLCRASGDGKRQEKGAGQACTFPCADTAAMRLATSSASPR